MRSTILTAASTLVDIRDEHQLAFRQNCILTQAAIKHTVSGTTSFYFDADIWQNLDQTQRVGLILHEALHAEFYDHVTRSSTMTRRFNGLLADADFALESITLDAYVEALRKIGVQWFEYHGWPFTIEETEFDDESAFGLLAAIDVTIPIKNSINSYVIVRGDLVCTFDPLDPKKVENPILKDILADSVAFSRRVRVKSSGQPSAPIVIDSAEGSRGIPSQLPAGTNNCSAPTLTPETRANPRIVLGNIILPVSKSCAMVIGDGYLWNALFLPELYRLENHPKFNLTSKRFDLSVDFDTPQSNFNFVPNHYFQGVSSKEMFCDSCSGKLFLGDRTIYVQKSFIFSLHEERSISFRINNGDPVATLNLPGGNTAQLEPGDILADYNGYLIQGNLSAKATIVMPNIFAAPDAVAVGSINLVYSDKIAGRLRGLRINLSSDTELASRVNGKRIMLRAGCEVSGLLQRDYPDTDTFLPEYSQNDPQGRPCAYPR